MKLTIYNNDPSEYDFDEARNACAECRDMDPSDLSDDEVWQYINDDINLAFDAERDNLDKPLAGRILCFGTLGLWWGRPTGYKRMGGNLNEVLSASVGDYYHVFVENGDICATDAHHDGTNHYTFRELRTDLFDEDEIEDFLALIYAGRQTKADIEKYTRSLAPCVCEIYGWKEAA